MATATLGPLLNECCEQGPVCDQNTEHAEARLESNRDVERFAGQVFEAILVPRCGYPLSLELFWGYLFLWGYLGLCWKYFGAILGLSVVFGTILGLCWGYFGPILGLFVSLGLIWGYSGTNL